MSGHASSPRRVVPWLAMVMGSLYVAIGGVVAVLLPAQVERIDADAKVAALAAITSIAFAVTLFAQPIIGAASDRTRDRFMGRAPWMLAGALVGGASVAAMGWAGSLIALGALWAIAQFALNGVDITASTSVVEDFPRGARGRPSGALAASIAGGAAVGVVIAGLLADAPTIASTALAVVAVAGAVTFVVARRSTAVGFTALPSAPLTRPRHALSDFGWATATRFSFTFGQQAVSTYLLYILSDHIGVARASAPALVSALTACGLAGLLAAAVLAGWWGDRKGSRRGLLVLASVVFGVGMTLPIVAPVLPVMFVYAALQGAGLGIHLAAGGALVAESLPAGDGRPGRDLGIANTVINAAQALAPLAAGAVVLATGGYVALFVLAMAAAGVSAAAAFRVRGIT